ncbi:MAG: RNA-dependent DNA polymerase [Candidatus Aenigmarchaeota archaeon CG_4_10_14_0_8_um_filter_37_24]|nr:RNA-dependent DNA polymerase [Candidatus Aenigmarchaeota archaeon]OIN85538.1 MAG: hypothetical protein AUJ50_04835 [Candidatus Aenigmarchaeota archaeon CG1_02_38_14]PIV68990.1 MAG: RNA-dependent DNA polymerase [Candidatus Aenigmarchaeota archaeon CG01_land_8_20_14_3_00_37_9]PIW40989.1 MAG: RNA-dependent DNA polymerase [Candidatus Aenigmarchaeota archaeon CG15_BIG_FIL_POST_REV_8_21_14_020_37_27]PIX51034.1 MAG: RNA-dependent DNA polymerase [Candidatus Aenigmarchaeota archaeon CG_4_8_14_3_um_fi
MKTYKNLMPKICDFGNLYNAYLKAKKGKTTRPEVVRFTYYLELRLIEIQDELAQGEFKTGEYKNFIVFEPKRREISALPFKDRVVQHGICNIIEPIFDKRFIHDSYACRIGKGTHAGINRVQKFVKQCGAGYTLKCDISKYFPSIDHSILKKIVRKKIADHQLLSLLDEIIDSTNREKGIPIGNLTSQLFANIYLNEFDQFVKNELKSKLYVRYMDDFVIFHEAKDILWYQKRKIQSFLSTQLNLTLHPRKVSVSPVFLGVDILGYKIFSAHMLARKKTVKRFITRVKKKIWKYNRDRISFDKLMESVSSWEAYLDHADTYNLKRSLHEKYFGSVM